MKTKQVIDAVTDGITAIPGLPKLKGTFRYFRPLSLAGPTGQLVPALSVAPRKIDSTIETTDGGYEFVDHLLITWYGGILSEHGVGVADQGMSGEVIDNIAAMTKQMRAWSAGVPGLDFQNEATIGDVHFGPFPGGVWACEIQLGVKRWEL